MSKVLSSINIWNKLKARWDCDVPLLPGLSVWALLVGLGHECIHICCLHCCLLHVNTYFSVSSDQTKTETNYIPKTAEKWFMYVMFRASGRSHVPKCVFSFFLICELNEDEISLCIPRQVFRWISFSSWAVEEASSGRLRHSAISILMNFHTTLILKLNTCLILPLRCFWTLAPFLFVIHNFTLSLLCPCLTSLLLVLRRKLPPKLGRNWYFDTSSFFIHNNK